MRHIMPVTLDALGSGLEPSRESAMYELRTYSRELTASEVFELYAMGTG